GRLSVWILTALPIGVAFYISRVNPAYMKLLYSTRAGLIMTAVAACMLGVGIMWMRKVVKIDV
ncbi:MAG: type II secretion system F family protein, partial [Actinomycetota bacterium]